MKNDHGALRRYAADILDSPGMKLERDFIQHGKVSVYEHSVAVAAMCVRIARGLRLRVNEAALVRGALLHDYFLYDWHHPGHKWHGFTHPGTALENAARDFRLGVIERNMIASHMFPMTLPAPNCRESVILCLADKLCATAEIVHDRKTRALIWLKRKICCGKG